MDAADAAAMSDPERNPHFRRRWNDAGADLLASMPRAGGNTIGTLGLALQEALSRAAWSASAVRLRQPPEGPTDG